MKYKNQKIAKMNKWDLRELKRKKLEDSLKGEGRYLFVNNTRGDLTLNKTPLKGITINGEVSRTIPPNKTFEGDSYFFCLLKTGDLRLVEVIQTPPITQELIKENMEKKLILDQPERFTNQGQTEHVLPKIENKPLNESQPAPKPVNKLLTEDPLAGVEIILN